MIVRLTAKTAKKIKISPSESLPADTNPFIDWSTHLFSSDRVQYFLLTNTASLYSMVMYASGITNDSAFLKRITNYMGEFMRDDGFQFLYERLIAPETASILFSKTLNRSVTGSMNDLIYNAKVELTEGDMSPYDVSFKLNETPMSYLKYDHPREAFNKLLAQE